MAMHAARQHGASAVGITLSREQATRPRRRVAEAGPGGPGRDPPSGLPRPAGRAVRRHLVDRHVRARRPGPHGRSTSRRCSALLVPGGRLLNHAISKPGGSRARPRASFINRYVFPDGELLDVAGWSAPWSEPGSRSATSSRCASTTPAPCGRGWPTSRRLGRGRRAGRPGPGPHLAAVHGGVGQRVRRGRHRRPPGARRGARALGPERDARHPARLGLTLAAGRRAAAPAGQLSGRSAPCGRRGRAPVRSTHAARASKIARRLAVRLGDHGDRHPFVPPRAQGWHQRHLGQQRHAQLVGQLAHRPRRRTARSGCRRRR